MNLLKETLEILEEHNLTKKDVLWVGNKEVYTDFDNFKEISNIEYDAGFGSQKVATDLIIVGSNWWLERHEYDGSEWWEYKELPTKTNNKVILNSKIIGGMWETLKEKKAY